MLVMWPSLGTTISNSQLTLSLKETFDCAIVRFGLRTGNWLSHSDTINRRTNDQEHEATQQNAHAHNFRGIFLTSTLVWILSPDVSCSMHNMYVKTNLVVNTGIHIPVILTHLGLYELFTKVLQKKHPTSIWNFWLKNPGNSAIFWRV